MLQTYQICAKRRKNQSRCTANMSHLQVLPQCLSNSATKLLVSHHHLDLQSPVNVHNRDEKQTFESNLTKPALPANGPCEMKCYRNVSKRCKHHQAVRTALLKEILEIQNQKQCQQKCHEKYVKPCNTFSTGNMSARNARRNQAPCDWKLDSTTTSPIPNPPVPLHLSDLPRDFASVECKTCKLTHTKTSMSILDNSKMAKEYLTIDNHILSYQSSSKKTKSKFNSGMYAGASHGK